MHDLHDGDTERTPSRLQFFIVPIGEFNNIVMHIVHPWKFNCRRNIPGANEVCTRHDPHQTNL